MADRDLSNVDIKLEGIGHVLRDRRLQVPAYQRRYSWEEEEVSDFWWDLRAAFEATHPQYFLGTIVLTRGSGGAQSMIIDGQQRLTTTSLLFVALRNEFLRRGDTSRAQVIDRDYGFTVDLRSGSDVTRLVLNAEDQPAYEAALRKSTDPKVITASPSTSRIGGALLFFEQQIRQEAKNAGTHWAETLFRWVEFLEHRARVINVAVPDESDAFLIFETLNARGRALTVADLLKNYLFGLAGSEIDAMQTRWISALRALETSADEEIFTTYVRHLWASLHGATRERELYARLKAAITSTPSALAFGTQLDQSAPLYAALLSSDQAFWSERPAMRPIAETLLRLGLEQNRPLLLAAMRRFPDKELAKLITAVISWSVRGLVVGGIGGGTMERAYAEAAVAVDEKRAKNTQDVFGELAPVIPADETFREAFSVRRINRTRVAKYLLVALCHAEGGAPRPSLIADSTEAEYDLDTVLPRTADANTWRAFPSDEISQWTYRLGNLYVARKDSNLRGPSDDLLLTESWSPDRISERQAALAKLAIDVWPRRP